MSQYLKMLWPPMRISLSSVELESVKDVPDELFRGGMHLVSCVGSRSVFLNDLFDLWSPSSVFGEFYELLIVSRYQSVIGC